jgi:hypothetical protein
MLPKDEPGRVDVPSIGWARGVCRAGRFGSLETRPAAPLVEARPAQLLRAGQGNAAADHDADRPGWRGCKTAPTSLEHSRVSASARSSTLCLAVMIARAISRKTGICGGECGYAPRSSSRVASPARSLIPPYARKSPLRTAFFPAVLVIVMATLPRTIHWR